MDDKFRKDLRQELSNIFTQEFEKQFTKLFNQGVDEAIIPKFDRS